MAVHVERGSEQTALVRFSLPQSDAEGGVSIVGSFNEWTPGAHQFNEDLDGQCSVTIEVPYGQEILFRYLGEGGRWFDDPDAEVSGDRGGRIWAVVAGDEAAAGAERNSEDSSVPAAQPVLDLNTDPVKTNP